MTQSALAFAALAAVLTITPGIDTAFIVRLTATGGRRAGLLAVGGICSGLWAWGLLSVLGIAAIVQSSATAFDVLRLSGAAYILWIGIHALVASLRSGTIAASDTAPQRAISSPYLAGLTTNILNPKIGVFYVSVLPQFIPHGAPVLPSTLLLVAIHTVEGALWLFLLVCMIQRMSRVLERPRVKSALEAVTGISLIGLGVGLIVEHR
jgi:threonine/homoserine/homoserine lactone efflux protein